MASVTIHDLDEDVLADLERRAHDRNRTLEAELREILTRSVRQQPTPRMSGAELRALAEEIAARTPEVPQTDAAELVRAMRDER